GEVLDGLKVQRRTRNMRARLANTRDNLVGAQFAFAERLKLSEHAGGAAAAAASGKRSDRLHRGIFSNYVRKDAHLLRHRSEGKILISLDETGDAPGVLLREEPFWRQYKQIHIQANRANRHQQD